MTRESRLLVTVVLMSGISVAGLMLVASQYRKALTRTTPSRVGSGEASVRAVMLVDGYLTARAAAKAVVARYPGSFEQPTSEVTGAYRTGRDNALTARGMTYAEYASVRAAWRTYRSGGLVEDPALAAALRARRAELENAGLGAWEALDDAIN